MFLLLPLLSLLATPSLCEEGSHLPFLRTQFVQFQTTYNKTYKSMEEEESRFLIFKENLLNIGQEQNRLEKEGRGYSVGVTQFSDLTQKQFEDLYLGSFTAPLAAPSKPQADYPRLSLEELPSSMDWRKEGIITAVRNQGGCGSCWAFATTAQIESYTALATGRLLDLSAQQLTSCSPNPFHCGGNGGCGGSIAQLAFNYVQLFGHVLEQDWPYRSGFTFSTGDCPPPELGSDPFKTVVGISGYDTLPHNDELAVLTHLATVGPLAVNVDASHWVSYHGGIFDGCSPDSSVGGDTVRINHAVQLVGFTRDYWIVRNSWGDTFGEEGYIRLARGTDCAVNNHPGDGVGCTGGPGSEVQNVCGQCGILFDVTYPLGVHSLEE